MVRSCTVPTRQDSPGRAGQWETLAPRRSAEPTSIVEAVLGLDERPAGLAKALSTVET